MLVLRLLTKQMMLLIEGGKTSPDTFRDELQKGGLPTIDRDLILHPTTFATFRQNLQDSTSEDMLLIKGTNFQFPRCSLERLEGPHWFNDDLILACLHLADRLPFVRIGFSIPLHQSTRPSRTMKRPFERAAKQLEQWRSEVEGSDRLVCLFPLFQRQNHFTLLEVNERDSSIYHYDSLSDGQSSILMVYTETPYILRSKTNLVKEQVQRRVPGL